MLKVAGTCEKECVNEILERKLKSWKTVCVREGEGERGSELEKEI